MNIFYFKRKPGETSNILEITIESSAAAGTGLTGLAFNTASLTCYYKRDVAAAAAAVTLATMTLGTFTSSGFKEVDATNMPGVYEFCPPDAALATGAKSVIVMLKGAANMYPVTLVIDLDNSMVESYSALHANPTEDQLLFEIRQSLTEKAISGTTVTVKKTDGTTTALTETLDSATSPTSITRAT